jgi:hypothetical protein
LSAQLKTFVVGFPFSFMPTRLCQKQAVATRVIWPEIFSERLTASSIVATSWDNALSASISEPPSRVCLNRRSFFTSDFGMMLPEWSYRAARTLDVPISIARTSSRLFCLDRKTYSGIRKK